ncbi:hemerythrin domain-containing protein [Clostridium chromiireducens]|uniref:Hemerythrin HHE cation binding domain protein n=1 Tax=Clostridium chromiireducens TaxID=225345 RepID=A0A1V4IEZ6_9CLOT|nr:hemerythrin domain-containing protein [Clostridium chromiireducens]OPJ58424.1 hemerythrin HHE cation binding domain protein [Clostridium chromiireducens]
MNAIDLMMEEHQYIKRMLVVVRKACFRVFKGDNINYEDFYSMIAFIRNYADSHHHKKEEVMLFNKMVDEIGETAEKIVKYGMLVEHDFGRLYITSLSDALENLKKGNEESVLDVISNAISYTHLLERHIDKEDKVIYKFAQRELNKETLNNIDEQCSEFESTNTNVKDENIAILEKLEGKYK